jgi:hypothetical protein
MKDIVAQMKRMSNSIKYISVFGLIVFLLFLVFFHNRSLNNGLFKQKIEGLDEVDASIYEDIGKKLNEFVLKKNEKPADEKQKIEGFELYGSRIDSSYKPEMFSSLEGGCKDDQISSYSNSKGYLCLSQDAIQQLKTRGGNQQSNSSQIGSP